LSHFSHPSRLTDPREEMKVPLLSLLVVARIKWSHSLASTNKKLPRLSKSIPSFGSSGGEHGGNATMKNNQLIDINVQTKVQTVLTYNPDLDRYVATSGPRRTYFRRHIKSLFIPQGVSPDYYNFIIWRIIQRYVNAILQVFGTQSLLLALGKKSSLTQAAALNWILKDTLGKLTRLIYGSLTSNKLDADAKRWRFRGSLLFALGNFLEIITFIFPRCFLLLGTVANSLKQMSMLTSSATRNTILSNFSVRGNMADITAKGEAQIAIVDLLGIFCGIKISKAVGINKFTNIIFVYATLQVLELVCMYKQISSVVFRRMNFERLWLVTNIFLDHKVSPTPEEICESERVFLPPDHLSRRSVAFGSLSRANLAPDELTDLQKIFSGEKYIIIVGQNRKKKSIFTKNPASDNCHIVLHAEANNEDIVKSTLNLAILRRKLESEDDIRRSRNSLLLLEKSKKECDEMFEVYMSSLDESRWKTEFLFGRCSMRSIWPLRLPPAISI